MYRLEGDALTVAADPRGLLVAAGGRTSVVRTWRRDTHAAVATVDVGKAWVHSVAFRPDGKTLAIAVDRSQGDFQFATGAGIGLVRFVDPATGDDRTPPISFDNGPPISLAWSPDGRRLAAVTADNFLHVYDAHTRRPAGPVLESVDSPFEDVTFSPDGKQVVAGAASGVTRHYEVHSGREVPPALQGQQGEIAGVAYRPDGALLATTARGLSTTRLWDMPNGGQVGAELVGGRVPYTIRTVDLDKFAPSRPSFSPDGGHLVTVGADGAATLWDLEPQDWERAACSVAGRDLTAAEWREHLPGRRLVALCGS